MTDPLTPGRNSGLAIVSLVLVGVLALFMIVMESGNPISEFGNPVGSALYMIIVYLPLLLITAHILRSATRGKA